MKVVEAVGIKLYEKLKLNLAKAYRNRGKLFYMHKEL